MKEGRTTDNKCIASPESEAQTNENVDCGEMELPEHAIRRFARFLLPKIQADLGKQKSDESTQG